MKTFSKTRTKAKIQVLYQIKHVQYGTVYNPLRLNAVINMKVCQTVPRQTKWYVSIFPLFDSQPFCKWHYDVKTIGEKMLMWIRNYF